MKEFETVPFDKDYKTMISSAFQKKVELEKVYLLNGGIALQHADIILEYLAKWNHSFRR